MQLHARFGRLAAHAPLVAAATLAADGGSERGFRLADVQFFFFLFGNWIERDAMRAEDRLELTQVRRLLLRLHDAHAVAVRGRPPRYRLTASGVGELVSILANAADTASFEEALFVATFFRCYGTAIALRVPAKARSLLDPRAIARRARRRTERVLGDLEERIRTSHEVAGVAQRARHAGPRAVAAAVEAAGAYQLQHVRAFTSFVVALPPALRDFELGPAFSLRAELLFETLAHRARAELAAWDRFAAAL